jgi:hypothetical protein
MGRRPRRLSMIQLRPGTLRTLDGIVVGILLLLAVLLMGVSVAHSAELVPALGISRSSSDGTTRAFGSVAYRPSLIPMVKPASPIAPGGIPAQLHERIGGCGDQDLNYDQRSSTAR